MAKQLQDIWAVFKPWVLNILCQSSISIKFWLLNSDRLHLQDYLHKLLDYRQTDKVQGLILVLLCIKPEKEVMDGQTDG